MKLVASFVLGILMLAAYAAPTSASSCEPGRGRTTAELDGLYLWVEGHDARHTSFGVWRESNALDGLQRWDAVFDETCGGAVPADDEVFVFYAL